VARGSSPKNPDQRVCIIFLVYGISSLFYYVFVWVCLCVYGPVTTITRNCHQTASVGEGSDHLQLIKFGPSCAP